MIPSIEQRHSAGFRLLARGGDAPDTSGQNEAALQSVQLSKDQLDWAKQLYAETAPDRAAATARANEVSDVQLDAMKKQGALADEAADNYRSTYQPLEKQQVQDALSYDSEGRREQAAGEAIAGVKQQFTAAGAAAERNLQRAGVNPSDGQAMATRNATGYAQALGSAKAATDARSMVEQMGAAKLNDAIATGRGISSSQASNLNLASQVGNSSVANAATGLNAGQSGAGAMQAGFNGAQSSLNGAASIYGNIANAQAQSNAADSSNLMAGAGAAATVAAAVI